MLTRAASMDELVREAAGRLDKMLACGTTTCEIKTGYGLASETELKMLRVIAELDNAHAIDIVPTFLAAHAVPPEYRDDANAYVDLICGEMLPLAWDWFENSHFAVKETPFYADVFCERSAYSLAQAKLILDCASGLGFRLKAHVDQFTNLGGSALGIESGATSIDHLDVISDEEIRSLASSDTVGIVIPTETFNAGKTGYADARRMIDAGCAVALSTDFNPGSAPCPSMPMAMAIACRYQRLSPAESVNAATINAAFGIGMASDVGSIEFGKQADLLIIGADDYRQICYEFGGNLVVTVLKGGEIVYGH